MVPTVLPEASLTTAVKLKRLAPACPVVGWTTTTLRASAPWVTVTLCVAE